MRTSRSAPWLVAVLLAALGVSTTAAPSDRRGGLLTGTYRLDAYGSDDPNDALDAMLGALTDAKRAAVRSRILPHVTPSRTLVIEQRGIVIRLGSTAATKRQFVADGQFRSGAGADGSPARVRAELSNSGFDVIVEDGEGDFLTAKYALSEGGKRLVVDCKVFSPTLDEPVVVESVYVRAPDTRERADQARLAGTALNGDAAR